MALTGLDLSMEFLWHCVPREIFGKNKVVTKNRTLLGLKPRTRILV